MAWLERLSVIVACVLPAGLVDAAREAPKQAPAPASLAGQLLVATPIMGDPRFSQTVILMARHDKNGAFGIVINRPVGERPLKSLLEAMGETAAGVEGKVRIFVGGPVQTDLGFVVHSADYRRADTVDIDGRVAVTSSREILRDIGHQQGPKKSLIAFGYSGWGPGQLEGELALHAWFTAEEDIALIFDEDRDKVWDQAMKRRTQDL
ncbi:MAG TPA: YqgE/AlgH family protein [Xanthobacteraceae bacterium]|nr:YqgE/AlgH family protein [Xanthobacteraceae bacterium]